MKLLFMVLVSTLFLMPAAGRAQSVETEQEGVSAELLEPRQAGGVLPLAVRFTNLGPETANFNRYPVGHTTLVDTEIRIDLSADVLFDFDKAAIAIAGDFTIDLDSVGGYTGRGYGAITISSEGWIQASSTGGLTRPPSLPRTPLPAAELEPLRGAVATAIRQPWPATNNSPADRGCCGRVKWTLRLQQRGADESRTFVTTWYDGQETYLPAHLAALRTLAVELLTRSNEARRRGGGR